MGQQQLLLIVLGVIVVGIAVVVGINLFNANAEESAKDGVVSDATNLGAMAQQFFKKPTSMGGGGNSFQPTGFPEFTIPASLAGTANGTYVVANTDTTAIITGTPVDGSGYTWYVETTVTPATINSEVIIP